jgi:hypothetical protein
MKILITEKQLRTLILKEGAALDKPVSGKITSPYGMRKLGGRKSKMHHGIDISVRSGTPIKSPADGVVRDAKFKVGACGGTLRIRHTNGLQTRYCHVKDFKGLKRDDVISRGDVIGLTGGNKGDKGRGNSTGAHLHYEVYKNGDTVNPQYYYSGGERETAHPVVFQPEEIDREEENIILWDGCGNHGCRGGIGPRNMREEVREMQTDLIALNYILPKFGIDGKFGPETLKAVNTFQSQHGFEENKVVTSEVLKAMKDEDNLNTKPEIVNDPQTVEDYEETGVISRDMNFSLPLGGRYYPGSQPVHSNDIIKYLIDKGLTAAQAAGVAGNIMSETAGTWHTGIIGDNGYSMGLAQWHNERLERLNDFAAKHEKDITDPILQLDYLWHELQNRENRAFRKLKQATTVENAAIAFMVHFERPASKDNREKRNKRARQARKALKTYSNAYIS